MLKQSIKLNKSFYNKKHKIYVSKMKMNFDLFKYNDDFDINDLVAYYIGDRNYPMKKIRSRFTGPFRITNRLNHNTVVIKDDTTNDTMVCHTQMLKKWHPIEFTNETILLRQLRQDAKINGDPKSSITINNNKITPITTTTTNPLIPINKNTSYIQLPTNLPPPQFPPILHH
jgi:hypothetical protein